VSGHLSWLEAGVIGLTQGVSELFPVSSLAHSVLIPAWVGGSWARDLDVSRPESPYLAFVVGLHVATAIALVVFFWRDWLRIVRGLVTSVAHRRVDTADERLAWLLVLATIPVGIVGLLTEHFLRTTLGRPYPTAVLLIVNGGILWGIERFRDQHADADAESESGPDLEPAVDAESPAHQVFVDERRRGSAADLVLSRMSVSRAVAIGSSQILALAAGISRAGIATVAGMWLGLKREDAARFSFLLATPVILAAGVLKLPDLTGPLGDGIRGQVLFGSVLSGLGAYVSVRFLTRYFATRSLRPFAAYCVAAGVGSLVLFTVR
jgi:undecaprenyl-diphosphatase